MAWLNIRSGALATIRGAMPQGTSGRTLASVEPLLQNLRECSAEYQGTVTIRQCHCPEQECVVGAREGIRIVLNPQKHPEDVKHSKTCLGGDSKTASGGHGGLHHSF